MIGLLFALWPMWLGLVVALVLAILGEPEADA